MTTERPDWMTDGQWTTETLTGELIGVGGDATGVARPGDTLVFSSTGEHLTEPIVENVKQTLLDRLPGIADVVIVPLALTAIYRPDTDPEQENQQP